MNPNDTVNLLKGKVEALKKSKKELDRRVRNAQRKTKRLKDKAKQLTKEDLMQIMVLKHDSEMKDHALEEPSAVPGSAASSSSGSHPTTPSNGPIFEDQQREAETEP